VRRGAGHASGFGRGALRALRTPRPHGCAPSPPRGFASMCAPDPNPDPNPNRRLPCGDHRCAALHGGVGGVPLLRARRTSASWRLRVSRALPTGWARADAPPERSRRSCGILWHLRPYHRPEAPPATPRHAPSTTRHRLDEGSPTHPHGRVADEVESTVPLTVCTEMCPVKCAQGL
jgi:hypothetical protein